MSHVDVPTQLENNEQTTGNILGIIVVLLMDRSGCKTTLQSYEHEYIWYKTNKVWAHKFKLLIYFSNSLTSFKGLNLRLQNDYKLYWPDKFCGHTVVFACYSLPLLFPWFIYENICLLHVLPFLLLDVICVPLSVLAKNVGIHKMPFSVVSHYLMYFNHTTLMEGGKVVFLVLKMSNWIQEILNVKVT